MKDPLVGLSHLFDVMRYGHERAKVRQDIVDRYLSDHDLTFRFLAARYGWAGDEFSYFRARVDYYEKLENGQESPVPVLRTAWQIYSKIEDTVAHPEFHRQCTAIDRIFRSQKPL